MSLQPITREAPPLASRPVIGQRWSEVAMLHWRMDPAEVERQLPRGLRADTFDGSSWVGLICFRLSRSALFGGPPIPYFGTFPEVNVRLYTVDPQGRRGIWFVSLEASRLAAVAAARAAFALPYEWAGMSIAREGDVRRYTSTRIVRPDARAVAEIRVGTTPVDDEQSRFLTARWGMHTYRGGVLTWRANVHQPWALAAAEVLELENGLFETAGLRGVEPGAPESVLFGSPVDALFARGIRVPL
jgi:uncharacterized protein YqjF (DUF2071 family)